MLGVVLPKLHPAKKAAAPGHSHEEQVNSEKAVKIIQREETLLKRPLFTIIFC